MLCYVCLLLLLAARGKLFCSGHGGGKRCNEPNCKSGAVGGSNKCIAHGGGKRCSLAGWLLCLCVFYVHLVYFV